jgi:hypothetical protein
MGFGPSSTFEDLRALTLWRPWPHAFFYGGKRVENRKRKPYKSVIGSTIVLHAGQHYDVKGADWMRDKGLYNPPEEQWCPLGRLVGSAVVTDYVHESETLLVSLGDWFFGPYGWLFDDVREFESPIKCDGKQGLWKVPAEILDEVIAAIDKARRCG